MEKRVRGIKKFFAEFKTFITRGNVLDLAVGVIIGGAFTGIVNGLSNFVLKPIINWLLAMILGKDGLSGAVTILGEPAYLEDSVTVDLANSIYIDWGSFISAIINFLIVALVLFMIVRTMNQIATARERMIDGMELKEKKAIAKIRLEEKVSKKQAIAIYEARLAEEQAKKAEEERLATEKAEQEARLAEEKATANTRLLEEIRDLLKNK